MKNRLILTTLCAGASVSSVVASDVEKPNFALFISDDCTFRDLGCYGSDDSLTPNIDNFAKESMLFERCYQAASMSSPTRHNLYTGIWPVKSGAYPNHTFANEGTLSIVHHLRGSGYKVALFGKSHVAPESTFPFDTYVSSDDNGDLPYGDIEKFIEECNASHTPFCVIVAANEPHSPWNKGDATQFEPKNITLPPVYADTPMTRKLFCSYLAEINYMDKSFGRVLKSLDDKEVADNTVVVFVSEQGNSFPFAKWTCYDVGVRSACLVRWTNVVEPGSKSDAIVEYVDIVPTFVDIAGAEFAAPVDGKSFRGVLEGKNHTHKKYTFSLQTTRSIIAGAPFYGIRSVCDGRYRYIWNLTPEATFQNAATRNNSFKDWQKAATDDPHAKNMVERYLHRPAYELYNTEKDPYCSENLYGKSGYKAITSELSAELEKWMEECGDKGQDTEMEAYGHTHRKEPKSNK